MVSKYPSTQQLTQRLCGTCDGKTSPLSSNLKLRFRFILLPSDDGKSAMYFFQLEVSRGFSHWLSNIFQAFVYQATIESAPLRICLGRSQVLRSLWPSETVMWPMTKQSLWGKVSDGKSSSKFGFVALADSEKCYQVIPGYTRLYQVTGYQI